MVCFQFVVHPKLAGWFRPDICGTGIPPVEDTGETPVPQKPESSEPEKKVDAALVIPVGHGGPTLPFGLVPRLAGLSQVFLETFLR